MRVIVLAAGEGLQLDGFNKLLIRDPISGKPVIELYQDLFSGMEMTVVVGCRAIEVMHAYPHLHYVYNADWRLAGSAHSLALALGAEPCFVISADMFLSPRIIERMKTGPSDCALLSDRENRTASALNCVLDQHQRIKEMYQGQLKDGAHPEAVGVFKITTADVLRKWKRNCQERAGEFAGCTLPLDVGSGIFGVAQGRDRFDEVNTHEDYLRLLEKVQS